MGENKGERKMERKTKEANKLVSQEARSEEWILRKSLKKKGVGKSMNLELILLFLEEVLLGLRQLLLHTLHEERGVLLLRLQQESTNLVKMSTTINSQ